MSHTEQVTPPATSTSRAVAAAKPPLAYRLLAELWLGPRNIAIAVMRGYRAAISPLYGDVCRYYPSCSRYAMEAFQRQGFLAGIVLTGWRLLRCNPFSPGGIDDPPERKHPKFVINTRGFVRPAARKA